MKVKVINVRLMRIEEVEFEIQRMAKNSVLCKDLKGNVEFIVEHHTDEFYIHRNVFNKLNEPQSLFTLVLRETCGIKTVWLARTSTM
jgi:hypothetical protein